MPSRVLRALRNPPIGVGLVFLIVAVHDGGHWVILSLVFSSWYIGYMTGSKALRRPRDA